MKDQDLFKPDLIRLRQDKGIAFLEFSFSVPHKAKDAETTQETKSNDDDEGEDSKKETKKDKSDDGEDTAKGVKIQKRIDSALALHHSVLSGRKINVELTVGGGGNSKNRLEKLKVKNEKMMIKRKARIDKDREEDLKRKKKLREEQQANGGGDAGNAGGNGGPKSVGGIHPSRLGLIEQ
ncbi:unnamed protein product [Ambrosiozyma monospora]|uniref:Unnamed protein product n=1 Tax=Ambrosiozyma monospora TaxID=43982 RepID=A0A9W6SYM4_AMBMO|nr:unnamed protein product [Ambrosiozyma monospora]